MVCGLKQQNCKGHISEFMFSLDACSLNGQPCWGSYLQKGGSPGSTPSTGLSLMAPPTPFFERHYRQTAVSPHSGSDR